MAKDRTNAYAGAESTARRGCSGCLVTMLLLLVAVFGLGYFGYRSISNEINGSSRAGDGGQEIVLEVPEGSSTIAIANMLKENGVIGSARIFRLYSQLTDVSSSFMYGEHTFQPGMSYEDISKELSGVLIEQIPCNTITFPEGRTCLSMAETLEEYGYGTVEEFISICNNETFDVDFFNYISNNSLKFIKLEGFLYPDTYDFPLDATLYDCIEMMLKNFEEKVWTPEIKSAVENSGYSLEEVITMASIVEKESFDGAENRVASVFWNRIERPIDDLGAAPMLQSDTTDVWIQYVLEYYYEGNAPEDMVNAYNSDYVQGIIVGPICNPGLVCIEATLNPENTNYYFFVTDEAKNFYWAETYSQHVQNCEQADLVNQQIENGTYEG